MSRCSAHETAQGLLECAGSVLYEIARRARQRGDEPLLVHDLEDTAVAIIDASETIAGYREMCDRRPFMGGRCGHRGLRE